MRGSVYRRLPRLFKPFIFRIIALAILEAMYCAFSFIVTYLNGYSIDVLSSPFGDNDLVRLFCFYSAIGLAYFCIIYLMRMSQIKLLKRADFHLRHAALDKIAASDYEEVCKTGHKINTLALFESDIPKISELPFIVIETGANAIQLVMVVFLLYRTGQLVGTLGLVVLFCSLGTVYFFGRKMTDISMKVQRTWDGCLDNYRHQVFQFKNIRLLGITRLYRKYEDVLEEDNFVWSVRRQRYLCLRTIANITYWTGIGLIYLVEGHELMKGNLSIGTIFTTTGLLFQIVGPCDIVVLNVQNIQIARSSIERFNAVLAMPSDHENIPVMDDDQIVSGVKEKSFAFDDVCFRYNGAKNRTIDGLNATLAQNGITFLQGRNGAGKTTFLLLLSGLLHETTGRIHRPSGKCDKSEIAAVFTDMEIPRIPLRSFVEGLGCDMAWLQEKGHQLFDHDLLDKFNAAIEENKILDETLLSVGQRQKIMFLIVLAQHKPMLLLDEAFSSMDIESEHYCYEIIREELRKSLTYCVSAAHTREDFTEQNDVVCVLSGTAS